MYRLWLHGLYGLHGPCCLLSEKGYQTLSLTDSISIDNTPYLAHEIWAVASFQNKLFDQRICIHRNVKNYYWKYFFNLILSLNHISVPSCCAICLKLWVHDDVIKWKHFPRNWPFVREIHRSPVNFPHKGQWRGALMFSLMYAWINDWVNNREAGDLRLQHGHYDVIVMVWFIGKWFVVLSRVSLFKTHCSVCFKNSWVFLDGSREMCKEIVAMTYCSCGISMAWWITGVLL